MAACVSGPHKEIAAYVQNGTGNNPAETTDPQSKSSSHKGGNPSKLTGN